ncbi:MAG: dipeptidase PepV [Halanaerobiales bacterium]
MGKIYRLVNNYRDDIIATTQELINTRSIEKKAKPDAPFGPGVNNALKMFLGKAAELGLKSKNIDGYAGHIEIGSGDELVGILCHLDVVPVGDNWTVDPFGGNIINDRLYGRGAVDNKGPAVAVLYALKALQDSGTSINKKIRLILGTDEESGWKGLEYYLDREEKPGIAFSPDASFPVIHAEKGILVFSLNKNLSKDRNNNQEDNPHRIISIKGGNAPNMVPDSCEAVLESDLPDKLQTRINAEIEKCNFDLKLISEGEDCFRLKSFGVSAHGSMPEEGENAISRLLVFLKNLGLFQGDIYEIISFYHNYIGLETDGSSLGCDFEDHVSGKLIFNVGMIDINHRQAKIVINIRYPVTYKKEEIYSALNEKTGKANFVIEELEYFAPLHVPQDDPLVHKLMHVYEEITGENSSPKAIGGGTYARALDKAVAFGPRFPGRPKLAHQADEYIEISDLMDCARIYTEALYSLSR